MLSLALYNIYLSDLPSAPHQHTKDLIYADDVTQIVTSTRSLRLQNERIVQQITRINLFEKCWKIQTNLNKFKHPGIHKDDVLKPSSSPYAEKTAPSPLMVYIDLNHYLLITNYASINHLYCQN